MQNHPERTLYISVFYAQDKWHHLLPHIRHSIITHTETTGQLITPLVFFETSRGDSIQLALKYKRTHANDYLQELICTIDKFLAQYPSTVELQKLPVTGFFKNFPNNEIKYNLFNERSLLKGHYASIQKDISEMMLNFFDDHPVDDEGLFTLLVYIQKLILFKFPHLGQFSNFSDAIRLHLPDIDDDTFREALEYITEHTETTFTPFDSVSQR